MRRVLPRLVWIAAALAAQFAILEAGLRWWGSSEAAPGFQGLFVQDSRMGYRLKPGASTRFRTAEFETVISINAQGVRDDASFGPKPPGERRILVLGDSLVMAVQVPLAQTFTRQLEARLNAASGPGGPVYRVINAGVQGYGPVQEYLLYRHVLASLQPDLVLVGLYVANDAIEAADAAWRLEGREAPRSETPAQSGSLRRRWRQLVKQSMVLQIARLRLVSWLEPVMGGAPGLERALTTYLPEVPPDVDRGFRVTAECVRGIGALAAGQGAGAAVLLLPARFQLHDGEWEERRDRAAKKGFTLVRDGATHRAAKALADVPVPVLDVLPALRAAPGREGLYFAQSAHLTAEAHAVVAAAVADFLAASGWVAGGGSAAGER